MSRVDKIAILQTSDLPAPAEAALRRRFDCLRIPEDRESRNDFVARHGRRIRAIAGTGKGRVDAALINALPNLEIISVISAGLDGIDTDAAAARGIPIFNTSSILSDDVADLALWLVLGTARGLLNADRFVRNGDWPVQGAYPLGKTISDMNIGILGLGNIGKAIARRLNVMGTTVGYTGRTVQNDVPNRYFADVAVLATWCDLLIVSCPATQQTHHLVDRTVLDALGPEGIVINISRGSVVDEAALIEAIRKNDIFSAGLDVFEHEPLVPQTFVDSDRTVLLPHIGSATVGTRKRMWQAMVKSLMQHFSISAVDAFPMKRFDDDAAK
jgi:lactate dehydrogenase-like 2-hydroxyacid dehydrogenase